MSDSTSEILMGPPTSVPSFTDYDTNNDTAKTSKTPVKKTSLSTRIVEAMKVEPNRKFVISDLVDATWGNRNAVIKAANRLSGSGKGSGPVMRLSHGCYKYDASKEENSLVGLARSGSWKIENLRFVRKGAHDRGSSPSQALESNQVSDENDTPRSNKKMRQGYPRKLPTGQKIVWLESTNGTQEIWISANGAPPLSPDLVLNLIADLKEQGLDDTWLCTSVEINQDTQKVRVDACYTLQMMEGVILKCYQHGYNTRIEIAYRGKGSIRDVTDLIQFIQTAFDSGKANRDVLELKKHLAKHDRILEHRVKPSSISKNNVKMEKSLLLAQEKEYPIPTFKTGNQIKAEREGMPVSDK